MTGWSPWQTILGHTGCDMGMVMLDLYDWQIIEL